MLEDDHERIEIFSAVLRERWPEVELRFWRTAPTFIEHYSTVAVPPLLIALDHDLFKDDPLDPDPGDGRDVARFLVAQPPISPVLIHSTNSAAADSMLFALQEADWKASRISPLGEDWIEEDWFPMATRIIRKYWFKGAKPSRETE
jgi:hypothetical protein